MTINPNDISAWNNAKKHHAGVIEYFVRAYQDGAGRVPTASEIAKYAHFTDKEVQAGLRSLKKKGVIGSRDDGIYLVDAPLPALRPENELQYGVFVMEVGNGIRTFTAPVSA